MQSRPATSPNFHTPWYLIVSAIILCFAGNLNAQIMTSPVQRSVEGAQRSTEAAKRPNPRWPKPGQIVKELAAFESHEITAPWAAKTKQLAEYFCNETEVSSQDAVEVLVALHKQSQAAASLINQMKPQGAPQNIGSTKLISELQRFQYRLNRRIEVWAAVIDHANHSASAPAAKFKSVSLKGLPRNLDRLLEQQIPGNTGWQDYLAWDDLIEASKTINMDKKARQRLRLAARKFLARYHSPALTDQQREKFQPFFSPEILKAIRSVASEPVNHTNLMTLIELMEVEDSGKLGSISHHLNNEYQNLLWSNDPVANELAATVDSHWRNANFRVAANQRLLNQMLPQMPAMTEPVSERLQGAKISGQSMISNQLRIALIPNPREISLGIETVGQVASETVAKRSGFTFQNRGLADFKVLKKLAFSRTGVTSEAALATATARQRLIDLRGSFDNVPFIGRLSRKIAKQKAEESEPEALQLTKDRVETGAKQRVEQEVNQIVNVFRRGLHEKVLSRLISMDLEPETVQLSTSERRITGRYLIAGRDQMAAWQPRPTDFESDLLTVQFHQSAINNLIERFGLNGNKFDPISLGRHVEAITGIPYMPENAEAEATFEFAKYDGVRVDFEDGLASITFSFKKFQIGKGRPWKNIAVTAHFVPKYIGTRIVLDRKNVFEVKKTSSKKKSDLRLGDQMAIRGAFKVILDEQYAFDIVPAAVREKIPNLALGIDRFSLADGWCGVALENASELGQPIPIVAPEEVVPGSWSDQLGNFRTTKPQTQTPRTARRLGY